MRKSEVVPVFAENGLRFLLEKAAALYCCVSLSIAGKALLFLFVDFISSSHMDRMAAACCMDYSGHNDSQK
ncbi:hypothetical protein NDK25_07790 [Niallia taxi]|nr:hypothetical protein [Niallia taxi]MDE5052285.1 hypothetical protein [Niallia taxi]